MSFSFDSFSFDLEKNGSLSKVGDRLTSLLSEYREFLNTEHGTAFQTNSSPMQVSGDRVAIEAFAAGDTETLLADLQALGLQQASVFGRAIGGTIPITAIADMDGLESLQFAQPVMFATNVGATTSQGDLSMRADVARDTFAVDGSGVTVGVLSDSYNALSGATSDILSGDLPGPGNPNGFATPVNVLSDIPGASDEGRAMLQLIHDVAPGADLAFHTAFLGQANFANGIRNLAAAGAEVIVDDIIYLTEPMFQDGIVAQAVDEVVAGGASYFSSAGNSDRDAYESSFRRFVDPGSGIVAHDFDPGAGVDLFQNIAVPVGASVDIVFQWDSPFFSVSGGTGSLNDIDIFLVNSTGTTIVASSALANLNRDPVEILSFTNDGSFGGDQFNLLITNFAGADPGFMKYVVFGNATINEFDTNSGTLFGHANAAGAEAVGAAFYERTPAFGQNPPLLEPFSSPGPTPIFFDTAGNRLATPELRQKPEIVAPDGTNTTFFGQDIPQDPDVFPNFFGTSAAAPHAAAVAALLLDAVPSATPEDIANALETTALDMDDPSTPGFDVGFDNASGFGLIQADAAIAALLGESQQIAINDVTVNEGDGTAIFTVTLSEPNTSTVTVDFVNTPGTAAPAIDYLGSSNGTLTFNPGETTQTIEILIADDSEVEEDETFSITLSNAVGAVIADGEGIATIIDNDVDDPPIGNPPVAVNDLVETDEDSAIAIPASDLLANDSDPDSDPLTVTEVDGSNTTGAVTFNGTTIAYNPNGQFEFLAVGETATDSFGYTISDGGDTDTAIVQVTVNGVNDAPTAGDDTASTDANTPVTLLAATLLSNDSDPDTSDILSVDTLGNATNGTVDFDTNGDVVFTPTPDFSGDASFTYTVSDGNGGTDEATVNLTITEVSDTIVGTPGQDTLVGTPGDDEIEAIGGDDLVAGELGDDVIFGGDGDDVLRGDKNLRSSQGNIEGGDDTIFGGAGSDRIGGKSGNDLLFGDEGNDSIWGDDGDDTLTGGSGDDLLTGDDFSGGQGSDLFVLAVGEGSDTIADFELGTDFIGLAGGLTFDQLSLEGNKIRFGSEVLATLNGVDATALTAVDFTTI